MLSTAPLPSVAYAEAAAPTAITLPVQLGPNARERYRDIFTSIDAAKWADASTKLAAMDEGPLHPTARAIIFTAKDSMKISGQLFLPKNHKAGDKHPAAIFFHGGSRRQML